MIGREVLQGAHVVEAVGELDEDDPEVLPHREDHLAEGFRLLGGGVGQGDPADLGDPSTRWATESPKRSRTSSIVATVSRRCREEPGGHRLLVEVPVGEEEGDVQRVDEIRLPRLAQLPVVHLGGEDVRLVDELDIRGRVVACTRSTMSMRRSKRNPPPRRYFTRTFPWAISRSAITVGFSFRAVVSIVAPRPSRAVSRAWPRPP